MHKTAATPLACIYIGLIVYASLYPFTGWRDQGITPGAFLLAPMPRYWTWFDVWINWVGYVPLGSVLALSAQRSGGGRRAVIGALVLASSLSLTMEFLQSYLPSRVASREDWLLNTGGAWMGLAVTLALERLGGIDRWSALRRRWFIPHSRGALVLLATWPVALLFPPAVPFGLGQIGERVHQWLALDVLPVGWLDAARPPALALLPLRPVFESLCVALGLLAPCLVAACVVRPGMRRPLFAAGLVLLGVLATALSALLSWGPNHAWSWLDGPTQWALLACVVCLPGLATLRPRVSASLLGAALVVLVVLLNRASSSPYFALTLQDWEQGRFIRFHGLAQWLGWCWPYAALLYALRVYRAGQTKTRIWE